MSAILFVRMSRGSCPNFYIYIHTLHLCRTGDKEINAIIIIIIVVGCPFVCDWLGTNRLSHSISIGPANSKMFFLKKFNQFSGQMENLRNAWRKRGTHSRLR